MVASRKYPGGLDRKRQIRLPRAMDEALVAIAVERGVTISDLLRHAAAEVFLLRPDGSKFTD